jgi:hypothetical protein
MDTASYLTIAYVTALLKSVLEHGLVRDRVADHVGGVAVSALPPEQAGAGPDEQARLNLFLSHVTPNTRVRPRDAAQLALDLHYIVAAHGARELQADTLLGYVSGLFRVCPGLAFVEGAWRPIRGGALGGELVDPPPVPGVSGALPELIGSLGITPVFPSADELSKFWSALQVRYRPSLSYKVELQPETAGPGRAR